MKKLSLKNISLRARIIIILAALTLTTLGGGLATIWYADTINSLITSVIDRDVVSFQIAEELETALVMQKGYATYYFQDGDRQWLTELDRYHKAFEERLKKAREYGRTEAAWVVLNKIESQYIQYNSGRDQVIRFYQAGDKAAGAGLHRKIRPQFLAIIGLCEQYMDIHKQKMTEAKKEAQTRRRYISAAALIAVQVAAMTVILLAYILFKQILGPIRRLALETGSPDSRPPISDEVRVLSRQVHDLIEDVDQTQSELARSQEHLLQSEKWAMTGKLAAGVAHSIRNPLTSVKIRLFSMGRLPGLSPAQKEDLEVISEEIRHIEAIVRSFLEFSRPPKLTMQKVSPSEVVDTAIRLLQHRLESAEVFVELIRDRPLPQIWADPDQLKEVLVNLLVNACEMMANGGMIRIQEEEKESESLVRVVTVSVSDNGPGIPEAILENIFQPFFSTKEEGTGLGLSIASRIVENHGGSLTVKSREGEGTTFVITLPCREDSEESGEKLGVKSSE